MLPEWMKTMESYKPEGDSYGFIVKTMQSLGKIVTRIAIQGAKRQGRKSKEDVSLIKLLLSIFVILFLSWNQNTMLLLYAFALVQLLLCFQKADFILSVLKAALLAAFLSALLFLPAIIMRPEGLANTLRIIGKIFVSVEVISMFYLTTQWNHITRALRKLHVPGVFLFTLDITLKYIVLLGKLLTDLLTALQLRSVGKNNKKQQSLGGVMGVTFLRSVEMSRETYEAMQCRGFTDDYDTL